jgi:hypothetical protein
MKLCIPYSMAEGAVTVSEGEVVKTTVKLTNAEALKISAAFSMAVQNILDERSDKSVNVSEFYKEGICPQSI